MLLLWMEDRLCEFSFVSLLFNILLSLGGERGTGEESALLLVWGDLDKVLALVAFLVGDEAISVDDCEHPIVIFNNYIHSLTNLIKAY